MASGAPRKSSASHLTPAEIGAFVHAAGNGDIKTVTEFLDNYGGEINGKGFGGWTALTMAAQEGETATVKLLLDRGADINLKDKDGFTALMNAAVEGHKETVTLLLERGAEINAQDDIGWTALMCAAMAGHKDIISMLLERGVDVDAKSDTEMTALDFARQDRKTEVVAVLEQWLEKRELERAKEKARNQAADIADFSPALKRDLPAPRTLKIPGPRRK